MTILTTLLLMFAFSLCLSLLLTPGVRALGIKFGAMDIPSERKVHRLPIPRIGGVAIFLSFAITGILFNFISPVFDELYVPNSNILTAHLGAIVVLCCGVWDDFRRLNPWTKLFFQIAAASLAFAGGATINGFFFNGVGIQFGFIVSYAITVFWFLLFINAVNLIDGLDGLAGGLIFFTCVMMAAFCYIHGAYLPAFYFALTGGSVLGFLKYNFNPATVFLGDGGSYFLGYTIAVLAIRSSTKSNVGVLMLIPLLALGVPIFDSILSPIRRFLQGRSIFSPDKEHIHHMLMKLGLSSQKVVYIIYCITLVFCVLSILIITLRDNNLDGLIMGGILLCMIIMVRKLGYFEYLAFDKFVGWFHDMTDVAGFSRNRRSFLSLQISTTNSQNMDELWEHVIEALKILNFHHAKLYLVDEPMREWTAEEEPSLAIHSTDDCKDTCSEDKENILRFEIPLREYGSRHFFGKLVMINDLQRGFLKPYTIRRVEHLRRSLIPALKRLKQKHT